MKKLLKKFETSMVAVTFAEAGEFATAHQILSEEERKTGKPGLQTTTVKRKASRSD